MADHDFCHFPLGRDIATCVVTTPLQDPSEAHPSPMRWLARYVQHCKISLDPNSPIDSAVRTYFSTAAWRLVCRSPRSRFLPILHNKLLNFHDLVKYAEALVHGGWQIAPQPGLLATLLRQRYEYFDSAPSVPTERSQMILLRLASRQTQLDQRDLMLVSRWLTQNDTTLKGPEQWNGLLRKAKAWADRRRAEQLTREDSPWHFYCGTTAWRGYEIVPLTHGMDLWEEGQAMSHCVFDLRQGCNLKAPSRFFSVRKKGRRVATIELEHEPVNEYLKGTDRLFGRWSLRDCRLSANRLMAADEVKHFKVFAWQYNLWSQRPGRQPCQVRNKA
jgi:hypothetical protein